MSKSQKSSSEQNQEADAVLSAANSVRHLELDENARFEFAQSHDIKCGCEYCKEFWEIKHPTTYHIAEWHTWDDETKRPKLVHVAVKRYYNFGWKIRFGHCEYSEYDQNLIKEITKDEHDKWHIEHEKKRVDKALENYKKLGPIKDA